MNLGNGGCARSREEIDRESYFHGMWMEGGKKSPLLCFSRLQIFFLPPFPPRRIHELFFRSRRVTFLSGFMPIFFRRFFRPLPFIISPLCLLFSTLILVKSPQFVSLPTSIFAPFLPPASLLYCFLFVLIYEARVGWKIAVNRGFRFCSSYQAGEGVVGNRGGKCSEKFQFSFLIRTFSCSGISANGNRDTLAWNYIYIYVYRESFLIEFVFFFFLVIEKNFEDRCDLFHDFVGKSAEKTR